ncbi:hypothetical protein D3C87_34150 [compost metagenome]
MRLFCWINVMNEQLDIFGGSISEYLIVIEPDHATSQKVILLKQQLNSIFPLSDDSLHSKPHISLCYFEANESSEELIEEKLNSAVSSIKQFPFRELRNGRTEHSYCNSFKMNQSVRFKKSFRSVSKGLSKLRI